MKNLTINVGDYVRTEYGIAKIKSFETKNKEVINLDKDIMLCNMDCYRNCCTINQVIKSSPNIIDLIEEGDLVKIEYFSNRYSKRVKRIFEVDYIYDKSICFENGYTRLNILNGEWSNQDKELKPIIKSIVTKEQFESMEYKIER